MNNSLVVWVLFLLGCRDVNWFTVNGTWIILGSIEGDLGARLRTRLRVLFGDIGFIRILYWCSLDICLHLGIRIWSSPIVNFILLGIECLIHLFPCHVLHLKRFHIVDEN